MTARRGKKRQFNFAALEHVGNDADEGGFLGDEAAEQERQTVKPDSEPHVPSPAAEPLPSSPDTSSPASAEASVTVAPVPAPEAHPVPEEPPASVPAASSAAEPVASHAAPARQFQAVPVEAPAAASSDFEPSDSAEPPAVEPAPGHRAPEPPQRVMRSSGRVNDGPAYSPLSAEPPVLRAAKPKRPSKKEKPAQTAVLASFTAQRTGRNWGMWSGRLVPETVVRLKARAEADAASSGRGRLSAGHYLDAALRSLPKNPEEQVALANDWLIQQWDGEHTAGRSAQFSVSPESAELLNGLRQSLRGYRHGIVIDVVCAAVDTFLDVLEAEGPIES
ncbi:hypothetical protein ACH4UT_32065 [Streptomyces sp. NPDC020799]|uniref:hypothetical protein n=1 Tax=Streptomyces sp. NPDC020799 TaxID=3365091 RepID=UPI00379C7252